MKNLIIAILMTAVFYLNICEVKMPVTIPFMVITFYLIVAEIDCEISDFLMRSRRGRRLQRRIRRLGE